MTLLDLLTRQIAQAAIARRQAERDYGWFHGWRDGRASAPLELLRQYLNDAPAQRRRAGQLIRSHLARRRLARNHTNPTTN